MCKSSATHAEGSWAVRAAFSVCAQVEGLLSRLRPFLGRSGYFDDTDGGASRAASCPDLASGSEASMALVALPRHLLGQGSCACVHPLFGSRSHQFVARCRGSLSCSSIFSCVAAASKTPNWPILRLSAMPVSAVLCCMPVNTSHLWMNRRVLSFPARACR